MGRKSGILLIVAGTLLMVLPPVWYFVPELMFSQILSMDPALKDTFYVVVHPHAGFFVAVLALVMLGLISFATGVRTVLRAP